MQLREAQQTYLPVDLLLPLIVLLEGFVSIAAEILTIRQLLPIVGGSVVVTSLIIGFFLLFLALGYRQGGRVKKNLQGVLRMNFLISSLWFGIGLSYIFIFAFFTLFQKFNDSTFIPLIAYLLLVTSPLIYILGQTVPITMNMFKKNVSIGMIGGDTLGLSTLGSFLGATVTALILMNFFGVAWTVLIVFAILLLLSLSLSHKGSTFLLYLGIAMIATFIVFQLNIKVEKELFILTNNYANYQLIDEKNNGLAHGEKILSINQSNSSFINQDKKGFRYVEAIKKILFQDLKLRYANILILGAGGFTISAENDYHNHFTYVDIDAQIKTVVVPNFLNQINGHLIVDDARHFIFSTNHTYQAIIVDVYSNAHSIPSHLLTKEFVMGLRQKLVHDGTIIFNIIAKASLADPYSKRIDNTIRSVLKNCMVSPLTYGSIETNILYVCHNSLNMGDNTTYSDNLNTATTDLWRSSNT